MSQIYDEYLQEHKSNVAKAFTWLKTNLPDIFDEEVLKDTEYNCIYAHDMSKSNKDEYDAYDVYFYGGNKSNQVVEDFRRAWLLHIHRNPHHWQHWVLLNDDPNEGEIILDMPDCYIIEMICDWWSFSWKTGNLLEILEWYNKRKDYIKLSKYTRDKVENILHKIITKLSAEIKINVDIPTPSSALNVAIDTDEMIKKAFNTNINDIAHSINENLKNGFINNAAQ